MKNNKLTNNRLIRDIDKMLSSEDDQMIVNNSILGFCAKLNSVKPKGDQNFRRDLFRKLIQKQQLTQDLSFTGRIKLNLNENILKLRTRTRRLSPVFGFSLILIFFWIIYANFLYITEPSLQNDFNALSSIHINSSQLNKVKNHEKVSEANMGTAYLSRDLSFGSSTNIMEIHNLKKGGNYRVLQEDKGFKLVEYTLNNGSIVTVVEGLF